MYLTTERDKLWRLRTVVCLKKWQLLLTGRKIHRNDKCWLHKTPEDPQNVISLLLWTTVLWTGMIKTPCLHHCPHHLKCSPSPEEHRVPFFFRCLPMLLIFCLFEAIVIRMSVKWYLTVLSICLSPMTKGIEHLFKWPFAHLLLRLVSWSFYPFLRLFLLLFYVIRVHNKF